MDACVLSDGLHLGRIAFGKHCCLSIAWPHIERIESGWFSSSNLSTSSGAHESRVCRYSMIRKNRKLHNFFVVFIFICVYLAMLAQTSHTHTHTPASTHRAAKKRKTIYCSHFIYPFYWSLGWSFVFFYNILFHTTVRLHL